MSIDKIKMGDDLTQSLDIVSDNISKLKELFPEVLTEGKIDFKVLQDILGNEIEEEEEFYRFTWSGKSQSRREAHKPSTGTLRPCKEESVDWDTTQNLYIEGDNLEVLKLLQKSYSNRVKMIYIDPPYNTGKDFVYKDNYKDNLKNYQRITRQIDDEGNKMSTNSENDGRYHSNWLNMMYPRLRLARNLLKEDGVIFMSIDDNELENLKKVSHEIFGEENFIGQWNWFKSGTPPNLSTKIKKKIEYILCYEKKKNSFKYKGLQKTSKSDDPITKSQNSLKILSFKPGELKIKLSDRVIKSGIYGTETYPNELLNDLIIRNGTNENQVCFKNRFIWVQSNLEEELKNGTEVKINTESLVISYKKLDYDEEVPPNLIDETVNVSTTENAGKYLKTLMDDIKVFSYPKPVELIQYLISFLDPVNEIILDFFSGSATTAESVLRYNSQNKFILVQIPQKINPDETSDSSEKQISQNALKFLSDYKLDSNLCELGKERIRRVGKKIKEENPLLSGNLDMGFKVFKLDSSNIKGWNGLPDNLEKSLFDSQDNIKSNRTEEDVLYEILLKYGLDLTLPIEEKVIEGKKVFNVGFGALFICLGNDLTSKVAEGIGQWKETLKPETCRVIFKDGGFTDVEKTNSVQTLKRFGIQEIKSI
jgi:adenine-specific DNA-methyltransferase